MTRNDVARATALIEEEEQLEQIEKYNGFRIVQDDGYDVYDRVESAVALTSHTQYLVTEAIKQRINEIKAELESLGVK